MSKTNDIANELLKRIRTNIYTEKIPGERELSDEFDVNVKTANRAVSQFIAPLNKRSDLTIGLCFFKHTQPGQDPVFTRFFSGVNSAVKSHGIRLDVTASQDVIGDQKISQAETLRQFHDAVLASNPDALIYLANVNAQLIKMLNDDRPTLVVGQASARATYDCVRRDIKQAVYDAVQHLHQKGHTHIAFFTGHAGVEDHDLIEKQQGYLDACADLKLKAQVILKNENTLKSVLNNKSKTTALIAAESSHGLRALKFAQTNNMTIPNDLAVISFDDGDVGTFTHPSMSSIHAFGEDLAQLAVQRILERLDGKIEGRIDDKIACTFIERDSSR